VNYDVKERWRFCLESLIQRDLIQEPRRDMLFVYWKTI